MTEVKYECPAWKKVFLSGIHLTMYLVQRRTVESVKFARGNFSRITVFSDIRKGINSRSAVVREVLLSVRDWPVASVGHTSKVSRGVKAGELGQTPAPGGCLPSREGVKTTLAFVLGHAVGVGLLDLAFMLGHGVGVG